MTNRFNRGPFPSKKNYRVTMGVLWGGLRGREVFEFRESSLAIVRGRAVHTMLEHTFLAGSDALHEIETWIESVQEIP